MVGLNEPGSIERVIAITEIECILNKYCMMARENAPFSEMASLFHANGIFRLPNGTEIQPFDMETVVQGKPPSFIRHHLTSVDIEFANAIEAKTKSLFFALTGTSTIDHWGYWQDVFRRTDDGKWLIEVRQIVVEGHAEDGWYAGAYAQ
ncbi:hypothetical protein N7462_002536 [Penicillium macrosclerotiorum]|uniref:uncharacterized protein n=1 Tax=Penicillium macrosclerotiorum TaxID=303699 RepID=UPI0025491376|nr:uncharacterized protein N7462_002536 [Penicillium macrosclerotiorum]KAJ5693113.1 hypothetical protein N7462_002536 [Penicillium macrosclerotiorum]